VSTEQPEFARHSFIVKIWLEEGEASRGLMKWRGHITHVASQERRYVERLEDISSFIKGYLAAIGAQLDTPEEHGQG
jgi:hypothetical protein